MAVVGDSLGAGIPDLEGGSPGPEEDTLDFEEGILGLEEGNLDPEVGNLGVDHLGVDRPGCSMSRKGSGHQGQHRLGVRHTSYVEGQAECLVELGFGLQLTEKRHAYQLASCRHRPSTPSSSS